MTFSLDRLVPSAPPTLASSVPVRGEQRAVSPSSSISSQQVDRVTGSRDGGISPVLLDQELAQVGAAILCSMAATGLPATIVASQPPFISRTPPVQGMWFYH